LTVVGTTLVVVLGAVVLVRTVDTRAMLESLSGADPRLLGAALCIYLLSWPVRGRRYGDVLAAMERRFRTRFLTMAVFASQTANLVVPARAGDGLRAYLLKDRRGVPYPTGAASLAVERAFDLVAIATLGGTAFAFLLLDGRGIAADDAALGTTVAVAVAAAALASSVATIAVARSDRTLGPAIRSRVDGPRLSSFVDAAVRFGASVRVVAERPRAIAAIYAGSVIVWALDVLTAVAVLAALVGFEGALSGWGLLVVGTLAVSVGNLAKVLPLSQGGVGLYEAAFTGLVVGVSPIGVEVAVLAAILDHALKNAVTLAGGAVAAIALGVSPARSREDTGNPATGPPDF
jgi:hypothetical protein